MVVKFASRSAESSVTALAAAVDELLAVSLTSLPAAELPMLAAAVETQLRRLPVFDHALIAEMLQRDVAGLLGVRDVAKVLVGALRIGDAEAKARVRAATDLGPRLGLSGEPLPPLFPEVVSAQSRGAISVQHAQVVTSTIDRLPHAVAADHAETVESVLVEHAHELTPEALRGLARRIRDHLDPDGTLADEADRQRLRALTLTTRANGSGRLSGELTPACAAKWQVLLDATSKPRAASAHERDARSPEQRRHDGFEAVADLLLRSDDLPESGGTPATVVVTMSLDQLEARTGLVTTSHGGPVSVAEALRIATEAEIVPTVLDDAGGVLTHGRTRRVASPRQRIVLAGRDGGCSFPGCDVPPDWTQAHHVRAWADGGDTAIDNLTLVCGFHHREHERAGWSCRMVAGTPEWIPPAWIDPERRPRRNTAHHLDRLLPSLGDEPRAPWADACRPTSRGTASGPRSKALLGHVEPARSEPFDRAVVPRPD